MKEWLSIVMRHFTTILVIIGLSWTIAKPHAEDFIRKTVNERITKIEIKLETQEILLRTILRKLDVMRDRNLHNDNRL